MTVVSLRPVPRARGAGLRLSALPCARLPGQQRQLKTEKPRAHSSALAFSGPGQLIDGGVLRPLV